MATHPLFRTLLSLRGNARGCVFTEPLWGIPFNLYAPYHSVYMRAFGIKDSQIGLIISIGMVVQTVTALLSGVITDKLGRKRATLIFDILAWSVPCLIWAVAQNFTYFVIAAIINSMWRITMTSWTCLLVEDTDPDLLVDIYSWIYISGLLAAFFAPLAGLLINRFSLVPTMRGLYLFSFLMMTTKFVVMNGMVTETRQGRVRMEETRGQRLGELLVEYRLVFRQILKAPQTLFTIGILLASGACHVINNTFWSINVTERILIPAEHLALYPFARSMVMLLFFFIISPRLAGVHFKNPMVIGFSLFVISQAMFILIPLKSYLLLLVSVILEACALALVNPQLDKMIAVTVEPKERARIMAIIYVVIIIFTAPFGWIAGMLSELNRILPFVLNILLLSMGGFLTYRAAKVAQAQTVDILPAS